MTSRTEYSTQTPKKSTLFSGQYLHNHWTLDIGVLGYNGIVWPKEHSPEFRSFLPGTPCIEEARCLKVKQVTACSFTKLLEIYIQHSYKFKNKTDYLHYVTFCDFLNHSLEQTGRVCTSLTYGIQNVYSTEDTNIFDVPKKNSTQNWTEHTNISQRSN